jgi:hypothetical protein
MRSVCRRVSAESTARNSRARDVPQSSGAVGSAAFVEIRTLSADQVRRLDAVSDVMPPYPYSPYRTQAGFRRLNPPI